MILENCAEVGPTWMRVVEEGVKGVGGKGATKPIGNLGLARRKPG